MAEIIETTECPVGRVCLQQALIASGLSYRAAARVAHVHPRTLWQHVAAREGSNVRGWSERPVSERKLALAYARRLIIERHINQ